MVQPNIFKYSKIFFSVPLPRESLHMHLKAHAVFPEAPSNWHSTHETRMTSKN